MRGNEGDGKLVTNLQFRITQRLRDDASLRQRGWDSYGADPIQDAALDAADALYARWQAVPTNSGGVQLELHTSGWDIELEIGPDGQPRGALVRWGPTDAKIDAN